MQCYVFDIIFSWTIITCFFDITTNSPTAMLSFTYLKIKNMLNKIRHLCIFFLEVGGYSLKLIQTVFDFWQTALPSFLGPNFWLIITFSLMSHCERPHGVLFSSESQVFTVVMEVEVSWVDSYPLSPGRGVLQSLPLGSVDSHPPWTTQLSTGQLLSLKRPTRPWNNVFWLYCSACLLVLQAHSLNFPWIEGRKAPLTCLLLLTAITSL